METSILELLQGENRTIAWLVAVVLAAGGTGIVVAGYLQWQRWRRVMAVRPLGGGRRRGRPVAQQPKVAAAPTAAPVRPATQGVAAYQAAQQAAATTAPEAGAPFADQGLDQLLARLHAAAGRLEEVAANVRSAGRLEDDASAMEFDVEFVHRHA